MGIAEIILLEDQSQPLPSLFSLDGVTDTPSLRKIWDAPGEYGEGLRAMERAHFTREYKPGFKHTITFERD